MENNKAICPVCGRTFVSRGIKNHILITAKQEMWKNLENKPHKLYYDNNKVEIAENKFISKV